MFVLSEESAGGRKQEEAASAAARAHGLARLGVRGKEVTAGERIPANQSIKFTTVRIYRCGALAKSASLLLNL